MAPEVMYRIWKRVSSLSQHKEVGRILVNHPVSTVSKKLGEFLTGLPIPFLNAALFT